MDLIPLALEEPVEAKPRAQVGGRVSGLTEGIMEVVFFGPNNILREAARVRPSADGAWSMDGLAPGRYRIQLDGGGQRVLVTEPPFLVLDIAPQGRTQTASFRLVGEH